MPKKVDFKHRPSSKSPDLRVISGTFRGRSLKSPSTHLTHPMGAREKLALFNMVNVENAKVLDAYAGSGALGIEALSRRAKEVIFVEKNRQVAGVIYDNLRSLDIAAKITSLDDDSDNVAAQVFVNKLATFAQEPRFWGYFGVILADPPYDQLDPEELQCLEKLLRRDGVLALSSPAEIEPVQLIGLRISSTHTYARARITIYRKIA